MVAVTGSGGNGDTGRDTFRTRPKRYWNSPPFGVHRRRRRQPPLGPGSEAVTSRDARGRVRRLSSPPRTALTIDEAARGGGGGGDDRAPRVIFYGGPRSLGACSTLTRAEEAGAPVCAARRRRPQRVPFPPSSPTTTANTSGPPHSPANHHYHPSRPRPFDRCREVGDLAMPLVQGVAGGVTFFITKNRFSRHLSHPLSLTVCDIRYVYLVLSYRGGANAVEPEGTNHQNPARGVRSSTIPIKDCLKNVEILLWPRKSNTFVVNKKTI